MKIQLGSGSFDQIKAEVIAIPLFEESKEVYGLQVVKIFLKDHPKFGKLYESQLLYEGEQKILLIGAGKKEKYNFDKAQNLAGTVTKNLLNKAKTAAIILPDDMVEAYTLGIEIAAHDPSLLYKTETEKPQLDTIHLIVDQITKQSQEQLKKGKLLAESINTARLLEDLPANVMTPTYFLNTAKKIAKENGLKITVLDESQAKKKGMGAFTGVAQGSEEPSYMIAIEYIGDVKSQEKWGLVGKGITFDSGGVSIKPSDLMHEMKYDMSGAAAVLATVETAAKLSLKTNIVGVMAVTENLPGGKAQKPGDIVKTYSGKTAEVLNTDAEGRLVLVDALTYAQRDFKATKLIDLATLTGAIIISLGEVRCGLFANDTQFAQKLIQSGNQVGEKYWEFPMDEEYNEMIKSDFADMANIGSGPQGSRSAGSITGAKFLEAVIEDNRPWIHLDIAGVAWDTRSRPFRGPGATGFGVKTLVNLISAE